MPQMSPMLWTILFIYFITLFLIFNILNYFNFIPTNKQSMNKSNNTSFKKSFMTWQW